MKIKKIISMAVFSFVFSDGIFAQVSSLDLYPPGWGWKGTFDARVNLGFGFPTGDQTIGTITTPTMQTRVGSSLGAGFNVGADIDYWFCDDFGAGLDFNDLQGLPIQTTYNSATDNYKYSETGTMFAVTPFVTFAAHTEKKWTPYAKFGPVFSCGASILDEYTNTGSGGASGNYQIKYTGGMAMGWYGAVGVQYPLCNNQNILFHGEIFERNINYSPSIGENIEAFSGSSLASPITYTNSKGLDNMDNDLRLKFASPFSSWGIMVGADIRLGKPKNK